MSLVAEPIGAPYFTTFVPARDCAPRDLVADRKVGRQHDPRALDHERLTGTDPRLGDEDIVLGVKEKQPPVVFSAHAQTQPRPRTPPQTFIAGSLQSAGNIVYRLGAGRTSQSSRRGPRECRPRLREMATLP